MIMNENGDGSRQPLRVGVVGLGWPGRVHIEAYQQIPGVQVAAIADIDESRLSEIGARYDVSRRFTEYRALIDQPDIDIVSVCTPNYLHAPVAIAAFEAGKHVLCEKPLARTTEEGRTIVQAAQTSGRALQVVFNQRVRSDVQTLKAYIDLGHLGRVYHTKAYWLRRNGIPGMGGWFTRHEMAGGGPLIDLGVHMLDMALYLLDEPRVLSVSAATYAELGIRGRGKRHAETRAQPSDHYDVEDLASAFIRLEGGGTLLLEASWATYRLDGDDFGLSLYGTDGGATIDVHNYDWRDTLRIFTDIAGSPADIHPQLYPVEGHLTVIRAFIDDLRGHNWSHLDGLAGLRRTQIIDACYRSAHEGREILLDSVNV